MTYVYCIDSSRALLNVSRLFIIQRSARDVRHADVMRNIWRLVMRGTASLSRVYRACERSHHVSGKDTIFAIDQYAVQALTFKDIRQTCIFDTGKLK